MRCSEPGGSVAVANSDGACGAELLIHIPRPMNKWIADYIRAQRAALDSIPVDQVARLIERLNKAVANDRQIFCFGNGGSAANSSHFATDLGKGSSDKIGNDYAYEDIFLRQIQNYGRPGDVALGLSVSGNSPNVVKALEWSKANGLHRSEEHTSEL